MEITIIITAFAILFIYSLFLFYHIYKKDKTKIWDWINTTLVNILSLIIGAVIAIFIFKYQNQLSNSDQEEKIDKLLSAEFNQQLQLLQNDGLKIFYTNGKTDTVLITQLQYSAINTALESGLYDSKTNEAFSNLSQKILHYNTIMQAFINTMPVVTKSDNQTKFYVKNINEAKKIIVITIEKMQRNFYDKYMNETDNEGKNPPISPLIKVINGKVQIDFDILYAEWYGDISTEEMNLNVKALRSLPPRTKICKAYIKNNPYLIPLIKAAGYSKAFTISAFLNGYDLKYELYGILEKDENGVFFGLGSK